MGSVNADHALSHVLNKWTCKAAAPLSSGLYSDRSPGWHSKVSFFLLLFIFISPSIQLQGTRSLIPPDNAFLYSVLYILN